MITKITPKYLCWCHHTLIWKEDYQKFFESQKVSFLLQLQQNWSILMQNPNAIDLFCFQIQCVSLLNWSSKNARHPLRLFWNISNFTFKGIYNPPDNIRIKIGKAIIEALFEFGKMPHNCILDVIKVNIYNLPKLKLTLKRQPSCFAFCLQYESFYLYVMSHYLQELHFYPYLG